MKPPAPEHHLMFGVETEAGWVSATDFGGCFTREKSGQFLPLDEISQFDPRRTTAYLTGRREPHCWEFCGGGACDPRCWMYLLCEKQRWPLTSWMGGRDVNNWSCFFYSKMKRRSLLIKLALWEGTADSVVQGWDLIFTFSVSFCPPPPFVYPTC